MEDMQPRRVEDVIPRMTVVDYLRQFRSPIVGETEVVDTDVVIIPESVLAIQEHCASLRTLEDLHAFGPPSRYKLVVE